MKLSRFLYHSTRQGKKSVRRLLAAGRVTVDGQVEKNSQHEVGEFTLVALDGETLRQETAVYIMLNKPAGYLSATTDPEHPTVMELIDVPQTLHIAGRLDRASTGLLILTNDGKWSRLLTEPKEAVPKTYLVTTAEIIVPETVAHFQNGIYFAYEDLTTQPAELEIIADKEARVTIYEGRYHQVKRMFHAVGNKVTSLHRERVGNIYLDPDLEEGTYRHLEPGEISTLDSEFGAGEK